MPFTAGGESGETFLVQERNELLDGRVYPPHMSLDCEIFPVGFVKISVVLRVLSGEKLVFAPRQLERGAPSQSQMGDRFVLSDLTNLSGTEQLGLFREKDSKLVKENTKRV